MIREQYKIMVIGKPSWDRLCAALPKLPWNKGMERGFSLHTCGQGNKVIGAYIYAETVKLDTHDEETLEPKEVSNRLIRKAPFTLNFQKGLVWCGKAGELNALFEALDSIPDVHLAFEQLNLNLLEMFEELQSAYKKNEYAGLKIRDYLSREHLIGNPTFKFLEQADAHNVIAKFSDQLDELKVKFKLPDGAVSVTITKRGQLRVSDDSPDELLMFIRDLLPRFHEAEVETAEVVDPGNK